MKISFTKKEVALLKGILQGELECTWEETEMNPIEENYETYFKVKGLLKKVKDQEVKDFNRKLKISFKKLSKMRIC